MSHEVGAGQLVEDTGLPLRTIQYWTDLQILKAKPATDRQGRGKHRVYDAGPPYHGERAWALIAAELHRLRLPVGTIGKIMETLRFAVAQETITNKDGELVEHELAGLRIPLAGKPLVLVIRLFEDDSAGPGRFLISWATSFDKISFRKERSGYLLNLTEILRPLAAKA